MSDNVTPNRVDYNRTWYEQTLHSAVVHHVAPVRFSLMPLIFKDHSERAASMMREDHCDHEYSDTEDLQRLVIDLKEIEGAGVPLDDRIHNQEIMKPGNPNVEAGPPSSKISALEDGTTATGSSAMEETTIKEVGTAEEPFAISAVEFATDAIGYDSGVEEIINLKNVQLPTPKEEKIIIAFIEEIDKEKIVEPVEVQEAMKSKEKNGQKHDEKKAKNIEKKDVEVKESKAPKKKIVMRSILKRNVVKKSAESVDKLIPVVDLSGEQSGPVPTTSTELDPVDKRNEGAGPSTGEVVKSPKKSVKFRGTRKRELASKTPKSRVPSPKKLRRSSRVRAKKAGRSRRSSRKCTSTKESLKELLRNVTGPRNLGTRRSKKRATSRKSAKKPASNSSRREGPATRSSRPIPPSPPEKENVADNSQEDPVTLRQLLTDYKNLNEEKMMRNVSRNDQSISDTDSDDESDDVIVRPGIEVPPLYKIVRDLNTGEDILVPDSSYQPEDFDNPQPSTSSGSASVGRDYPQTYGNYNRPEPSTRSTSTFRRAGRTASTKYRDRSSRQATSSRDLRSSGSTHSTFGDEEAAYALLSLSEGDSRRGQEESEEPTPGPSRHSKYPQISKGGGKPGKK